LENPADALYNKVEGEQKKEVGAYLSTLKSRFHFTDAQISELQKALAADEEFGGDYLTKPDADWQASIDKMLEAMVSPAQKEALAAYLDERHANRVEVNTTREMANLQQHLTLSPEQKDKVYDLLSNFADGRDRSPDGDAMALSKTLRDGMSKVLTPDQMKVYEKTPAARVAVKKGDVNIDSDSVFSNAADPDPDTGPDEDLSDDTGRRGGSAEGSRHRHRHRHRHVAKCLRPLRRVLV